MRRPLLTLAAIVTASAALVVALNATRQAQAQSRGRAGIAGAPISYFIASGNGKAGFRNSDPELARWALNAWERTGSGIRFEPTAESAALIRVYWAEPVGGQYGETQALTVNGQRGAAVYIRPDVESLGPDIAERTRLDPLLRESIVYLTCVHEIGHALGLEHTNDFRDIMYFFGYGGDIVYYFVRYRTQLRSRSDIASVSGLSEGDVRRLKVIYVPQP